ncbi:trypsin-like serine peptidase [Thermomonospora umbrina]|nr:hypothetical protein [Thermomonospora umbrina]
MQNSLPRVFLGGLAAAVVGATALAGAATAAQAAPTAQAPRPGAIEAVQAPVSTDVRSSMTERSLSADQAIKAYWTPERMRNAIPVKAPRRTTGAPSTAPEGTPNEAPPAAPAVSAADRVKRSPARGTVAGSDDDVSASTAVGKVFFRNAVDGRNYVCSAGTVNSNSKRLVSTAGHCVHGGAGGAWHQNWVVAPYYGHGDRGTWSARNLVSFTGWTQNSNFDYDVGFVKVHDLNGQQIVNAVGGHGLQTGQSKSRFMTILGYPAEAPYPGTHQYYCQGTTSPSGNRISMPCPLTRGVSGGPWLYGYDNSSGLGYINGTSSTTNAGRTTLWSPYFSGDVWNLYNYADGL